MLPLLRLTFNTMTSLNTKRLCPLAYVNNSIKKWHWSGGTARECIRIRACKISRRTDLNNMLNMKRKTKNGSNGIMQHPYPFWKGGHWPCCYEHSLRSCCLSARKSLVGILMYPLKKKPLFRFFFVFVFVVLYIIYSNATGVLVVPLNCWTIFLDESDPSASVKLDNQKKECGQVAQRDRPFWLCERQSCNASHWSMCQISMIAQSL